MTAEREARGDGVIRRPGQRSDSGLDAGIRRKPPTPGVMAGLDPGIHAAPHARKDVDARDKPGHDGGERRVVME